ncbi:MAG: hypothetical protein QME40_01865 [bacterium]|nr:hypothetical protein [bacterium]
MIETGFYRYVDAVAFHPYVATPGQSLKRVEKFLQILDMYQIKKSLWITKIGWQTGGWPESPGVVKDDNIKASYLKQTFKLLSPLGEAIFGKEL